MRVEAASIVGNTTRFLREHRVDVVVLLAVLLLTAASRILTMEPIENGGDPLDYWYFVKEWHHDIDVSHIRWNHHRARLGIHWMLWVVQSLFGEDPKYYYVAPVVVSVLVSGLVYLLARLSIGRSMLGRCTGILAVLLVLEFDPLVSASSQVRPAIFGCMYVLGGALCLAAYTQATTDRARILLSVAIAAFGFGGYLSVETSVFFLPGTLTIMWFSQRRWRDCALVCGLLFAGFCLETLFLRETGGESRLKAVAWRGIGQRTPSYWQFLERLTSKLNGDSYKLVLYSFFVAGPIVLVLGSTVARISALLPMFFLVFVVLVPRGLSPLRPMLPMRDRYFDLMVPFAFITHVSLIALMAREALERLPRLRLVRAPVGETRGFHWLVERRATLCAAFVGLVAAGYGAKVWSENKAHLRNHPFQETSQTYAIVSDAYARGLPIIADWDMSRGGPNGRARDLHWAYNGFLSSELLLENGKLKDYMYDRATRALNKREVYMPATLDAAAVAEYVRKNPRCVLRLSGRKWPNSATDFVKLSTNRKLPKDCKSPK
jgi:hypothetical protein